jgi:hypothetical protein
MDKLKVMFIISVLIVAIVIVAINVMIRQTEKEIIYTPAQRITEVQGIEIQKEDVSSKEEKTEELPPRIVPPGEESFN